MCYHLRPLAPPTWTTSISTQKWCKNKQQLNQHFLIELNWMGQFQSGSSYSLHSSLSKDNMYVKASTKQQPLMQKKWDDTQVLSC